MFRSVTSMVGKMDRLIYRCSNRARLLRLSVLGASIGRGVRIYGRVVVIGDARNLTIGDGSTLNEGVIIELRSKVVVGRRVHISSHVRLHTGGLDVQQHALQKKWEHTSSPIYIEDDVWLASGVLVGGGVRIGAGTVVAAHSVVLSDIESSVLAAGAPAKIRRRFGDHQ